MSGHPAPAAPAFTSGRTISELVIPVVAGSLHDRVVPLGAMLAEAWELPVKLVHVTPSVSSIDEPLEAVREGVTSWYPQIDVRAKHLTGDDPAVAIADSVGPNALLVMSTDHIDAWAVKGSVAEDVVERVGLPVLLVGQRVSKQDMRRRGLAGEIVVGVDGSARAEVGVQAAAAMAEALSHRRLWLVQVVPTPSSGDVAGPQSGRYLQELAEKHSQSIETRWEVVQSNDPVEALESFAARRDAGFLVAATQGRATTQRHTIASIAAGLVSRAERPVLMLTAADVAVLDAG